MPTCAENVPWGIFRDLGACRVGETLPRFDALLKKEHIDGT